MTQGMGGDETTQEVGGDKTTSPLVRALDADTGVTCVVGAGGKKSTLYALARRLPRAVVTATVRIPPFENHVASVRITNRPAEICSDASEWPLGVVAARDGPDRYRGYHPTVIDDLADAVGRERPILVKADGARSRLFKAPNEEEPRIPKTADTVVVLVSARVVGRRLDARTVHRPERVAKIADISLGDRIRPEHVATVLASERGGRKNVPSSATVIPVVNMADDPEMEALAQHVAEDLLGRMDAPHVVISRMTATDPVVEIVT